MSETRDKVFIDGLFFKQPREGSPEFVKGQISILRKDLGNFLRSRDEEWINIDVKESKNGKMYCELNTWKPDAKNEPTRKDPFVDSDIPF
tara:strand:+ start:773 stop:1042 length:270 start_codon:yes stop_codon:yes gene_type:complete